MRVMGVKDGMKDGSEGFGFHSAALMRGGIQGLMSCGVGGDLLVDRRDVDNSPSDSGRSRPTSKLFAGLVETPLGLDTSNGWITSDLWWAVQQSQETVIDPKMPAHCCSGQSMFHSPSSLST